MSASHRIGAVVRTLEASPAVERLASVLQAVPEIEKIVVAAPAGPDDAQDRVGRMLRAAEGMDHVVDCSDRLDCSGREADIAAMIEFHLEGRYDATEPRGFLSQTMPRIVRRGTLERIRAHSARWPYYAHFAAVGARVGGFRSSQSAVPLERDFFEALKRYRERDGHLMIRLLEFEYFAFPLQLVVRRPLRSMTVLELGSGRHFGMSLFYALAGARRVYALDADAGVRSTPEEDRALYETLRDGPVSQSLFSMAVDGRPLDTRSSLDRLFRGGRVDPKRLSWLCPAVAEAIPLPRASVDLCTSFSTLEHVNDLDRAAKEVRRVLRRGGWAIHWIDLKDHERPNDPTRLLRVPAAQWGLEPVGAPNRARFEDHLGAFRRAGLKVRAILPRQVVPVSARERARFDLPFRRRSLGELAVQFFGVVLKA